MTKTACLLVVTVIALQCGCGKNAGPSTPIEETVSAAWALFEQGQYEDAAGKFTEVIAENADWADAYNGRGWSFLELRRLDEAEGDFNSAVQLSTAQGSLQISDESRTGLASILLATRESSEAAQILQAVINADPAFQFAHRTSIDIVDVRLMLSSAFLDLTSSASNSDQVDSYFDDIGLQLNAIDTQNTLERDDPYSWKVGQERYGSFEEAILEKLEWLINTYLG